MVLAVIAHFRVRAMAPLFLAGAAYGWFIEGVIVQTMYDDFPLNLSFTGLAWHALISVMLGWVIVPAYLAGGSIWRTAGLAAAIGAGYGLWSLWWWTIEPPPTAPLAFAAYSLALTLALALSYGLAPRLGLKAFRPSRVEVGVLMLLAALWYTLITVPAQPLSLIMLPPLAVLLFVTLLRNRQSETRPDQIRAMLAAPPPSAAQLLALIMLPAAASAVYTLATVLKVRPPTGLLLYLITVPLGFGLLVWALVTAWRRPEQALPSGPAVAEASPPPIL
jgi:hypothetical protein